MPSLKKSITSSTELVLRERKGSVGYMTKRGRPKGRSRDKKSYGPLGDLIRSYRLQREMGLADVAKVCDCSVQFISNIEHGRAPLPWEKARLLAKVLRIPMEELQASNLAVRSDFKSFIGTSSAQGSSPGLRTGKKAGQLLGLKSAASLVALTARDRDLREILERYQLATDSAKKRFFETAREALA